MWSILLRGWNWCTRFRYRCGYGVHSPSDFHFISFVIYESLPYYAYAELCDKRRTMLAFPHYREKTDKFLFRLTNYLHPQSIWEFGTGGGIETRYMAAARSASLFTWSDTQLSDQVRSFLQEESSIIIDIGDLCHIIKMWTSNNQYPDLVHIAHTSHYKEVFEAIQPLMKPSSCIVVAFPYANAEKKQWWKQIIQDTRVGVTFDLYDLGLIFFDFKRIKEHRIINFL